MAWSPGDSLVIGISSRALFDLDAEDHVYRTEGTQAFIEYQRAHEDIIISRGVAFRLVEALLGLNKRLGTTEKPAIEIVIMSKNHPDCAIRIHQSLQHYGIRIKRAVFTGGQEFQPLLRELQVDLFLSKEEDAVRAAIQSGIPAGLIYGGPPEVAQSEGVPVLAFDGDAVLFSDQAERVFREKKLAGFEESELMNAKIPLPSGPLRRFAQALEEVRADEPIDTPPFRIALVTSRDFTFCERPIRTLREWGIRVDQAFFVSDMSKNIVLKTINPLIFFDDSQKHCAEASAATPTVQIPLLEADVVAVAASSESSRASRFTSVCKLVLKKSFGDHKSTLEKWQVENLSPLSDEVFSGLVDEFERSAAATPRGHQRRSYGADNEDITKLLAFLENLLRKHRGH